MRKTCFLFISLSWTLTSLGQAQIKIKPQRTVGFIVGSGFQNLGQLYSSKMDIWGLHTHYFYKVNFFELHIEQTIKTNTQSEFALTIRPQVNQTVFKENDTDELVQNGFETGIVLGLKLRKKLVNPNPKIYWFTELGIGPHYISEAPTRQVPGFIFSDNLSFGLEFRPQPTIRHFASLGFRHVSNAGFQNPNGGINSICMTMGLAWNWD